MLTESQRPDAPTSVPALLTTWLIVLGLTVVMTTRRSRQAR
jgi:hypothetical protein